MTSQTTTQEDLLQPGHIVKERWKVVCILTDLNFPPKNRPLII